MKNIFITNIPMMGDRLKKGIYESADDYGIDTNVETAFPIIPVIKAKQEDGVETKVIALRFDNPNSRTNMEMFFDELESVGVSRDQVVDIAVEENQKDVTGINIFLSALKEIDDHSDVYACVTYSTNIMSMMSMYLLDSLEYLKDNVKVQGVYYGEVQRLDDQEQRRLFYDITNLVFLNHAIKEISDLKLSDPEKMLEKLLEK